MQTLSKKSSFKGVFTALATPFTKSSAIDWQSYEVLLDSQIQTGVAGVVVCGTTGESPTLTSEEKKKLIELAVRKCNGRLLVVAGTGSNNTQKTIEESKSACDLGVDGLLVVTPYYNKPTQKGLEAHFTAVADACHAPLILYNVPGRTSVSLNAVTVASLAGHPSVLGIKEATGSLSFFSELRTKIKQKTKKDFYFLTGDDPTFWPFLACGGDGVISVASNVFPKNMCALYECWVAAKTTAGLALHDGLFSFLEALFIETNPAPVKQFLSWRLGFSPTVRLPLVELQKENLEKIKGVWDSLSSSLREDNPQAYDMSLSHSRPGKASA